MTHKFFAAPLQGHTDAPWRLFHHMEYPLSDIAYITPFIRLEKGVPRERDLRDFASPLNDSLPLEPQVIFSDADELRALLSALAQRGATVVNLNLGCPFPLQTKRGRGAGILPDPDRLLKATDVIKEFPGIRLSVKMRLGYDSPEEWRALMPALRRIDPTYVAVHPRTAKEQYSGPLHLDSFGEFLHEAEFPLVFNGELHTPSDIAAITDRFPDIAGVMAGRGIIARPSLFEEYVAGTEFPHDERISRLLRFHRQLFDHYCDTLCGDSQILSKIKPFWEYSEPEIGSKAFKALKKSGSMPSYRRALNMIERALTDMHREYIP